MVERLGQFESGPYIQAALFCERVLDEKDNVKSLIRVIDRLNVQGYGQDPTEPMPPIERDLTGILMFKAGDARGPVLIRITLTEPSGLTRLEPVWQGTIHFEGGTRGQNLNMRVRQRFEAPGPYWFNVYVGDRLATRMPFEVIFTVTTTRGPSQTPPPP